MHMLHKILVRLERPDLVELGDDGALRCIAAARAEDETDNYGGYVFDYRETESAGRWSADYPQNVLLSKNGVDKFIGEIAEVAEYQNDVIERHLSELRKTSTDLNVLRKEISSGGTAWQTAYHLQMFTNLLTGKYEFDSGFYDLDAYTARADEKTIERVRNSPDEWALVMFDYHI